MSEQESRYTNRERSLDELAKGVAGGTVSRGKALRWLGAALFGGAVASIPGVALAAPCPKGRIKCRGECCAEGVTTCVGTGKDKTCGTVGCPRTCCCDCLYSNNAGGPGISTCTNAVVAGTPEEIGTQCEQICRDNVPEGFTFAGHTAGCYGPNTDPLTENARIFCSPSTSEEFPGTMCQGQYDACQ